MPCQLQLDGKGLECEKVGESGALSTEARVHTLFLLCKYMLVWMSVCRNVTGFDLEDSQDYLCTMPFADSVWFVLFVVSSPSMSRDMFRHGSSAWPDGTRGLR